MIKPKCLNFNPKEYPWKKNHNYKEYPEKYKVGKGEQGVLICQPYKGEILPHWKFKTPEIAKRSSDKIFAMFLDYLNRNEFVGADMARKYLQMGYTRSKRYANYKGGKKYNRDSNYSLNQYGTGDKTKLISARLFYYKWKEAEDHSAYKDLKKRWRNDYG